MKEISENFNEKDTESFSIMMDFKKVCDRVDREIIETTARDMNFEEAKIKMMQLLRADSLAVVVTSDVMGEAFRRNKGVK